MRALARKTEGASHKRDVEIGGWGAIEFVGRPKICAPEFNPLANKDGG